GTIYDDILEKLATKVMGRIIHMPDGKAVYQRYGKDDSEHNYSISRIELNKFLIDAAQRDGAELHFDHAMSESSDFGSAETTGCTLNFRKGRLPAEQKLVRVNVTCPVIACDGAGSRIRYAMQRLGLTEFSEELLDRGYKEVLFPKPEEGKGFGTDGEDGNEACDGNFGLHIWPRGDHMLMALANVDGSFTGTFYAQNKGDEDSFDAFSDTPEGRKKCTDFCEKYYAKAVPLVGGVEAMVDQIVRNPNGILGTVRTTTWAVKGKVLLIGDSSHAMVPFFGQGCNCGFEDTYWLSRLLQEHVCGENGQVDLEKCSPDNFAAVFAALEEERRPNAEAICDMAMENFLEMRDKTGDLRFQAMKKVENRLENAFPEKFRSRYAMVCYGGEGNVSYANAKALGVVQATILEKLCHLGCLPEDAASIDLNEAEKLIDELLAPHHKELNIDLSTVKH
ncbi:unnamed protein product, partial [Polarella glacialis]